MRSFCCGVSSSLVAFTRRAQESTTGNLIMKTLDERHTKAQLQLMLIGVLRDERLNIVFIARDNHGSGPLRRLTNHYEPAAAS